jgi:hypothetical protein
MAKAYICEPSARGVGGHYLEYCMRAAAALSNSYESKIVVHAKFDVTSIEVNKQKFEIIRHFKTGYFEFPFHSLLEKMKSSLLGLRSRIQKLNLKKLVTSLVLRSLIAAQLAKHTKGIGRFFFLLMFLFATKLIYTIKEIEMVFGVLLLLGAVFAFRAKIKVVFMQLTGLSISRIRGFYWYFYNAFLSLKITSRKREIDVLVKREGLEKSDVLFLTSASYFDVLAIIRLLKKKNLSFTFWLVLRRDFDDWGISKHQWRYAGSFLKKYRNIEIFSDTELLQTEYSDLLNLEVKLLPIISSQAEHKISQKKFLMSYLGDLREEKGFDGFLQLLKSRRYDSEKFFSQAYFPPSLRASNLHFVSEMNQIPNLEVLGIAASTDQYFDLLRSSEIVYLNYRSIDYKMRSSGIFVETIHADSFPLVSQQTWMHKQISELSRGHHETLWSKGTPRAASLNEKISAGSGFLLFQIIGPPNRMMELVFRSNSGIFYETSCWSDNNGVAYTPGPFLREFETILIVNKKHSTNFHSISVLDCSNLEARWLGGLVLSAENNVSGAVDEYLRLRSTYIESLKCWDEFKAFHSEESFQKVLCGSQ